MALALLCQSVMAGEVRVEQDSESLRIRAVDATTCEILDAVAGETGLEVFSVAPLDRIVTLDLQSTSLPRLVRRLFRHESYLLIENNDGYSLWIHARELDGRDLHFPRRDDPVEDSWDDAIDSLYSNDPDRRADAIYALADVDAPASADLLRAALGDDDQAVQRAAIEVLGELGAIGILREHWSDLNAARRIDVVDAVGDSRGPGRLAFLRFVAGSGEPELAGAALQYLDEDR